MDSSEYLEFLTSRSSVREYKSTPVSEDKIRYILSCSRTAPSAGNLEAWDVVVVTEEEIRLQLARAAFDQPHVGEAPVVFVVCANYVRSMSRYGERGILYAVQDATIAATYMMLAVHTLHLHSCWTGAFEEEEVRSVLGLPQHVRPVVLLPVGHGHPPAELTGRMPEEEHVHREKW